MADIFISYAKEDERFVVALAGALGQSGYTVWWDRNIAHGEYFDRVIEAEIESARAVIVVWSENSVQSDWCRAEAAAALELGKLVPIAIQRAKPPLRFKHLQTGDFSGWKGDPSADPFATLCKDLAGYVPHPEALADQAEERADIASIPVQPRSRIVRYGTIAYIVAGLATGAVAINLYWENERLHQDGDSLAALLTKMGSSREGADQNSAASAPSPADKSKQSLIWPAVGAMIAGYGAKIDGRSNDGINIAVDAGTIVKSSGDGVVAYAGNELKGYGNLVLVRHSDGYVTAYAHLQDLLVHRGDTVKQGQIVAHSGSSGEVQSPQLHFEVRKGSTPVDPVTVLGPLPTIEQRDVAAVQRVLTEYGYGQIKPTGVMDDATVIALYKFQREHRLPLTDKISASLLADMSRLLGVSLK